MPRALRILLVERSASRPRLRERLLGNFDVNLTVHQAASEAELRQVARDFRPDVVLGSDHMPKDADLDWDVLLLPSRRAPEVLVCEFHEGHDPWESSGVHFQELPRPHPAKAPLPARHLGCVPDYFRHSDDAVVVLDAEGWVCHANAAAERLMGVPASARLHHANDLIDMLKAMSPGSRPALPLVMLNLNGLPLLTRAYGRTVANAILKTLSEVVQPRYARCGILARLSQDEVLLVLSRGAAASDAAVAVLGGKPLGQPYAIGHWPGERVAANHDVPLLTEEAAGRTALRAVKHDIRVKSREGLRHEVFDAQLGDAINRHALGVHYQPQFSLKDGRACGVEALARWTLNNGETLQPAAFIPLAERSGLIGALGATILKSACTTAAAWRGEEAGRLTLSVNVSQQQMDAKYARVLESALKASGLAPQRLELKVPERALSVRASAFDCLRSWKSLGVRVAVNHDGNDYSGLSYLSRLTVDRLKLNRHLVHRMLEDGRTAVLVRAVIALGAELGVEVMAEGVETYEQYALLQELGCTHAQGYLLARPMPAVQAHLALRRPWGNLPREQVRAGGALVN